MTHVPFTGLLAACVLMHATGASAQSASPEPKTQEKPVSKLDYEQRALKASLDGEPALAAQIYMLAYQEHGEFKSLDAAGAAFIKAERDELAYQVSARFFCDSDNSDHRDKLAARMSSIKPDEAIPDCNDQITTEQPSSRVFHMGINLRTDIGTHPFRFDFGVRAGALDVTLVLDPMIMIDGQHDADLLVARRGPWSPFAGYRLTTVALAEATHKQHKALIGLAANLPTIISGTIAGQLGVELSTLIVKHGADLPTESIFASNGRDFIDLLNFGLFLRFEYGSKF